MAHNGARRSAGGTARRVRAFLRLGVSSRPVIEQKTRHPVDTLLAAMFNISIVTGESQWQKWFKGSFTGSA